MNPIVIACGDHAGVGPEVVLKSVAHELARNPQTPSDLSEVPANPGQHHGGAPPRFVLAGDLQALNATRQQLGLHLPWTAWIHPGTPTPAPTASQVQVIDLPIADIRALTSPGSATPALHALACLRRATEGCLGGAFSALVTAPVSKESILRAGVEFVGQTEYLAELAGNPEVTMMLLGDDDLGRWLRVALVTTHLPLSAVPAAISRKSVLRTIRHAADACRQLGLSSQRIAVAGLNPHAGEGGMLGQEEDFHIRPAIDCAVDEGIDARGPIPGDTVFHRALLGAYDAVVAMYHDQGLAPLKLVAFDRGVNWTLGLPFIRTSPDHGTAFDIAGRGIADPSSMCSAIRLATQLASAAQHADRK